MVAALGDAERRALGLVHHNWRGSIGAVLQEELHHLGLVPAHCIYLTKRLSKWHKQRATRETYIQGACMSRPRSRPENCPAFANDVSRRSRSKPGPALCSPASAAAWQPLSSQSEAPMPASCSRSSTPCHAHRFRLLRSCQTCRNLSKTNQKTKKKKSFFFHPSVVRLFAKKGVVSHWSVKQSASSGLCPSEEGNPSSCLVD